MLSEPSKRLLHHIRDGDLAIWIGFRERSTTRRRGSENEFENIPWNVAAESKVGGCSVVYLESYMSVI